MSQYGTALWRKTYQNAFVFYFLFQSRQVMFVVQAHDDEMWSSDRHLVTLGKTVTFTPALDKSSASWFSAYMHRSHYQCVAKCIFVFAFSQVLTKCFRKTGNTDEGGAWCYLNLYVCLRLGSNTFTLVSLTVKFC